MSTHTLPPLRQLSMDKLTSALNDLPVGNEDESDSDEDAQARLLYLLKLGQWARNPDVPPPPPAPTNEGDERYFYLWHRPRDASSPQPERVRRIVASGGIVPGYYLDRLPNDPRGQVQAMRPRNESGFSENIRSFLDHYMNEATSLTLVSTGGVAWFYLNQTALEHAKEDELVFRVPLAWLKYNALFCVEQPPRSNETNPGWAPSRFVMDLKMPLAYRITSTAPLRNEETRAMSNHEVGQLLYDTHLTAEPTIRDAYTPEPTIRNVYTPEPEPSRSPRPAFTNPF